MANLQIKGIDDDFYKQIKELAVAENRSVSQQILYLTRRYLALPKDPRNTRTGAEVLLELAGSWSSKASADEIINDLRHSRVNAVRLKAGF
jgi:predicted CopG family antitoxin